MECLESLVVPRFIKDEKDVIDLEQEIKESTDDWHKRVLRVFCATTTVHVPPDQLVKSYCLSLKEHMQVAEHKELLREKVLGHIHQLEWYRLSMDDAKTSSVYYGLMEDVLAYYCTLELEVLHFKYPVRVRIARTPDVKLVIDRIYTVLTQFLGQKESHVTHALLKMKYASRSQVGREVRKHVYDMHLFRSPTRRLSEAAYCRHYVLFLKYKELLAPETHADKDQMFRIKFGDPKEVIARSSVMSQILFVRPKDVDDLMVTLPGIKRNIVKDYFRRLPEMSDVVVPEEVSDVEDEDYEIEIDDSMDEDSMADKEKRKVDDDVIYNGKSRRQFKIEVVDEAAYSDVEIQTIELAPKRRQRRAVKVKKENNQSLPAPDRDLFRMDDLSLLSEKQLSERAASSSDDSSSDSEDEDDPTRKPPKKPQKHHSPTAYLQPKDDSDDDVIALDSDEDDESDTDEERNDSSGSDDDDEERHDWERDFVRLSGYDNEEPKKKTAQEERSDDVVVVTEYSGSTYKNVEDVPLLYLSDLPNPFRNDKQVDTVDEVIQTEEATMACEAQADSNEQPSVPDVGLDERPSIPEVGPSKDLAEKPTEAKSSKQEQIMELLESLDQLLQDGDPSIKMELLKKFELLKATKPINGEKSELLKAPENLTKTPEELTKTSEEFAKASDEFPKNCEFSKISEEPSKTSGGLSKTSEELSKNCEELSQNCTLLSKASEELSKTSEELSKAPEELTKISEEFTKASEEFSKNCGLTKPSEEPSKITEELSKNCEELSQNYMELSKASEVDDLSSGMVIDERLEDKTDDLTTTEATAIADVEMVESDVVSEHQCNVVGEVSNAGKLEDIDASKLMSQLEEAVEEKVDDVPQDTEAEEVSTNISEWSEGISELIPSHEDLSEEVEIRDSISIAEEHIDILLQSDPEALDGDFNLLQSEVIIGDVEIVDVAKYEVVDTEGNEIKDVEQSNNNLPLPKEDLVAEVLGNSGIAISIAPAGLGLDHGLLTPEHSDDKEGSIGDENIINESRLLKFNDYSEDDSLHGQVYLEPATGSFININLDGRPTNDPLPIKILNIMSNYKPEGRKLDAKAEHCPMTADGKKIGSVRPMTVRNPKSIIEKALQDANVDFLSEKSNFYRGKVDGDPVDPPLYAADPPGYHLKIDDYLLEPDAPEPLKPMPHESNPVDDKQHDSDYDDCMFDAEENKIQGIDGFCVDGKMKTTTEKSKDPPAKGKVIFTSSTYIEPAKRSTASLEDFQRFEQNIYDQRIKKMKVNGAGADVDDEYDDFLFRDEISTKKRRPNDVKQKKKNQRHTVGWGPVITKTYDAFNEGAYQLLNGDATVHEVGSTAFTGHGLDRRSGGFEPLKSEFVPNGVRSGIDVSKSGHSKPKKKIGPAPPKGILKKKEVVPTLFNLDVHSEYERLKRKNKVEAPTCTVPPKIRKIATSGSGVVYCGVEPNDEKIHNLVPRICLPKFSESELRRQYYATFTDKLLSNHHTKQRCILYRMDIEKDRKEAERRKAEEEESLRLPSEVPDPDYLKKHPVSGTVDYSKILCDESSRFYNSDSDYGDDIAMPPYHISSNFSSPEKALNLTIPVGDDPNLQIEFSNSPKFLSDPQQLENCIIEKALQETTANTDHSINNLLNSKVKFLSDNSNFYTNKTEDGPYEATANSDSNLYSPEINVDDGKMYEHPELDTLEVCVQDSDPDVLKELNKFMIDESEKNYPSDPLKPDKDTRLPFKKRRMSVGAKQQEVAPPKKEEISYPATPMISIAEVEALHSKRQFKTPAERKEMPPLPPTVYPNVPTTAINQYSLAGYTTSNMSYVPMSFIPCTSFYPMPPVIIPFNNLSPGGIAPPKLVQQQMPYKTAKKEGRSKKEKTNENYCNFK